MKDSDLSRRFSRHVVGDGVLGAGDGLLVALSGGLDSTVLLHLLRFTRDLPHFHLQAAHFDHGMRPDSGADAEWVRGVCRAWRVPLHTDRADPPPGTEDEARDLRYGYLLQLKEREGLPWLLTGHHGDDQAETVLFRVSRGTGLRGLAGIPRNRPPGVYRPLLAFSRVELASYAAANRMAYRLDPTNRELKNPRNLLRHEILPRLEESVAPGVRASLRRLARLAEENEAAWQSLLPNLLEGVLLMDEDGWFVVRSALQAFHPAVQTRLLREILRRSGIELDEVGTREAVEFTRTGVSGRILTLRGGVRLIREFDRFRLAEAEESSGGKGTLGHGDPAGTGSSAEPEVLPVPDSDAGSGELALGTAAYRLVWGETRVEGCAWTLELPRDQVEFPLALRGWRPGDRIRLPYGTKKLKKLLAEAKIPVAERGRRPVLVDARNRVLWVPGVASSILVRARDPSRVLFFGIRHVDGS